MAAHRGTGHSHRAESAGDGGAATARAGAAPESTQEQEPALAGRLHRPGWRDPRLLVGIMIVLVSVAAVVALVAAQDRTVAVYAAGEDLDVGAAVDADDLRVEQVHLANAAEHYVTVEDGLDEDLQVLAAVDAGELLPQRAVGEADPQGRQAVILEVDHTLSSAVASGRSVDVWATYQSASQSEGQARADQVVTAATVASVSEDSSAFGSQQRTSVEVLIDPEDMAAVLEARGEAQIAVVPVGADPEGQL